MNYPTKMILVFISLSIAALFSGCSNNPNSSAPPSPAELIGNWTLTGAHSITSSTYHFKLLGIDSTVTSSTDSTYNFKGNNDKAEFRSDSTYTIQSDEGFLTGTGMVRDSGNWSLSGNTLHIKSHAGQSTKDLSVGINGNSGTFIYAINDSGMYLSMPLKITGTFELFATKN